MKDNIENGYVICKNEWALDKNIKENFRLFLYLLSLQKNNYIENLSLEEISKDLNTGKQRLMAKLNNLKEFGYIDFSRDKTSDKEVFKELNKKNSKKGCLFCGFNVKGCIDRHHYPVRHKDGGTETINLCPNCHRMFHIMAGDVFIKLNIKLLKGVNNDSQF